MYETIKLIINCSVDYFKEWSIFSGSSIVNIDNSVDRFFIESFT